MSSQSASVLVVLNRGEIVGRDVLGDLVPQEKSLDQGVAVVKACVNARAFYLAFKFMNVLEVVSGVRDRAADREVHLRCSKDIAPACWRANP